MTQGQRSIIGRLVEKVDNLRTWGADRLDYDAAPPTVATIDHAKRWIKVFYCSVVARDRTWINPLITASEEGEVMFEWQRKGRRLTIEMTESVVAYRTLCGWPPNLQFEDGIIDTVQRGQSLWAWLVDQEGREELSW